MALDLTELTAAVAADNENAVAAAPAIASATLTQVAQSAAAILITEMVASAGRRAGMLDIAMGQAVQALIKADPQTAISEVRELTASAGQDLAASMTALGDAIAQLQKLANPTTDTTG